MDGLDDLDTRLLVDLLRDHSDPRKSLGQHYLVDDQVIDRTMDIPSEFSEQLFSSQMIEKHRFDETTPTLCDGH